jgi:hypothetical protein
MKQATKYIFALCTAFSACSTHAGYSTGKITAMIVTTSNNLFFVAGNKTSSPSCATIAQQWSINLGTAQGKSIYALLLAAQAQDKSVTIIGNNTCNNWPDREDVQYGWTE